MTDLHEETLAHVLHADADGVEALHEGENPRQQLLVPGLGNEDVGRLLVEAILVEIADEQLSDAQPVLADGLQRELRQEVVLEAFRLGEGAFDELPAASLAASASARE